MARKRKKRKNPGNITYLEDLADSGYGGDYMDYYPKTFSGEKEAEVPYYAKNVIWDGIEGRMLRVKPKYATHILGNQFDEDKLAAVVQGINDSPERVVFDAPYGMIGKVGRSDIRDSQRGWEDEGLEAPLSTGDDDLDEYLRLGKKEYIEEYHDDLSKRERKEMIQELEDALVEAEEDGDGDFGEWTFEFRDGNHRAFGALISGEPYVYAILADLQFDDLDPSDPDDAELLDMLE